MPIMIMIMITIMIMGITHYVRNTRKRKVLTYQKKKSDCACAAYVTGE